MAVFDDINVEQKLAIERDSSSKMAYIYVDGN